MLFKVFPPSFLLVCLISSFRLSTYVKWKNYVLYIICITGTSKAKYSHALFINILWSVFDNFLPYYIPRGVRIMSPIQQFLPEKEELMLILITARSES